MQIFYDTSLQISSPKVGEIVTLSPELSHHIVVVLRNSTDQDIHLADGDGRLFLGHITAAAKKACQVQIDHIDQNFGRQCSAHINLAFVPTKSIDRVEWAVEKAIEIGARVISPIISSRSERKTLNIERLQRVAKSAAEQSLKGFLPVVKEPQKFADFIKENPNGLIAHCNNGNKIQIPLSQPSYTVLIGPEGDFSPEEVELAKENGYQEITLGSARLRAETAAVCAVFNCTL